MQDVSKLTKDELKSELNAMNYIDRWSSYDHAYYDRLNAEYHNRIEDECINNAKEN